MCQEKISYAFIWSSFTELPFVIGEILFIAYTLNTILMFQLASPFMVTFKLCLSFSLMSFFFHSKIDDSVVWITHFVDISDHLKVRDTIRNVISVELNVILSRDKKWNRFYTH